MCVRAECPQKTTCTLDGYEKWSTVIHTQQIRRIDKVLYHSQQMQHPGEPPEETFNKVFSAELRVQYKYKEPDNVISRQLFPAESTEEFLCLVGVHYDYVLKDHSTTGKTARVLPG